MSPWLVATAATLAAILATRVADAISSQNSANVLDVLQDRGPVYKGLAGNCGGNGLKTDCAKCRQHFTGWFGTNDIDTFCNDE
jgi:hypothetical protein